MEKEPDYRVPDVAWIFHPNHCSVTGEQYAPCYPVDCYIILDTRLTAFLNSLPRRSRSPVPFHASASDIPGMMNSFPGLRVGP